MEDEGPGENEGRIEHANKGQDCSSLHVCYACFVCRAKKVESKAKRSKADFEAPDQLDHIEPDHHWVPGQDLRTHTYHGAWLLRDDAVYLPAPAGSILDPRKMFFM